MILAVIILIIVIYILIYGWEYIVFGLCLWALYLLFSTEALWLPLILFSGFVVGGILLAVILENIGGSDKEGLRLKERL